MSLTESQKEGIEAFKVPIPAKSVELIEEKREENPEVQIFSVQVFFKFTYFHGF